MLRSLALLAVVAVPAPSRALELHVGGPLQLEVHAFVSQGFIYSTDDVNYLARSRDGSLELAEVGINFSKPLSEKLRVALQLFARDLGPLGDYEPDVDWFLLDYRWQDWLGLRAGRVKLPFGLYNDTSDVDAARVSILLPQSVYPIQNRDFLLAQTGAELYGFVPLGPAGLGEYRLYGGTPFIPTDGTSVDVLDLTTRVLGARLLWEPPITGLRLGLSGQRIRLVASYLPRAVEAEPTRIHVDITALLWVASAEYVIGDLLLATEYGRWHLDTESDQTGDSARIQERAYLLASYRLLDWLQPGAYVSWLDTDAGGTPLTERRGREEELLDLAATLRLDLTPNWLLKLEGHHHLGTAILSPDLNDRRAREELPRSWSAFLAKTTAYF